MHSEHQEPPAYPMENSNHPGCNNITTSQGMRCTIFTACQRTFLSFYSQCLKWQARAPRLKSRTMFSVQTSRHPERNESSGLPAVTGCCWKCLQYPVSFECVPRTLTGLTTTNNFTAISTNLNSRRIRSTT